LLAANPLPAAAELDPALNDRLLGEALAAVTDDAVSGQALTPCLLQLMLDGTGGASLDANLAAVRSNVRLATQIAVAYHLTPPEAP